MTPLDQALAAVASAQTQDADDTTRIWATWAALIDSSPDLLPALYRSYLDTVRAMLDDAPPAVLGGQAGALRFVLAFSASNYLSGFQRQKQAWMLLQQHHAEHLALLRAALARPDHPVLDPPPRFGTGRWGAGVVAMLTLYRRHRVFGPNSDHLEADIIPLLPDVFRSFPQEGHPTLILMLADHPDAAKIASDWIAFHLSADSDLSNAPTVSLALDLLGPHGHRFGPLFAKGPAILTRLLGDARHWPDARLAAFWHHFVDVPLQIEPVTQDAAARNARHLAGIYHNRIAQTADDSGFAARAQRDRDTQSAQQAQAEATLIDTDFAAWNARRRHAAIRSLSSSATRRKTLGLVAQKLPAPYGPMAQTLLDEAAADAARPKRFAIAKPAQNRFRDVGLKLLVIETLMYQQTLLQPRFDIHAFAAEYDKRDINVDAEGYAIIPEAKAFFANLPIPDDLLARVTTLHQSSGLDGGPAYGEHLFPFWDPGAGDTLPPVTAKAVADLDLLPNLTRISGLENSHPNRKLLSALKARGIALLPEDQHRRPQG